MKHIKYTKSLLEPIVAASSSVAEVMRTLGLRELGGNHTHMAKRIRKFGIDTSHFKGQFQGLVPGKPRPASEILVLRHKGPRQIAVRLRRALLEIGREYICVGCGNKGDHNGYELRLQVDHINGNYLDDTPDNLRFLCPNCHSQTTGWSKSKGLTGLISTKSGKSRAPKNIKQRKQAELKRLGITRTYGTCSVCGTALRVRGRKYCSYACRNTSLQKSDRPSKEILADELNTTPVTTLGKKYGVSDNAIRKWARSYGIVLEKRLGYWAKKKARKV